MDANYDISYTDGTVTVTAAPVPSPVPSPASTPAAITTTTATPPATAFPDADLTYPDGAIVSSGGRDYVLAGGRAFAVGSSLTAVKKVDHAKVVPAPAGIRAPTEGTLRPGTLVSTPAVNGNPTIYVASTDGQLHGFSTSAQFFQDGYDAALVVTVPGLGGASVGSTAGQKASPPLPWPPGPTGPSSTRGALFTSLPAGGPLASRRRRPWHAEGGRPRHGASRRRGQGRDERRRGQWGAAERPRQGVREYQGDLYLLKSEAQLAVDGYGGTAACPSLVPAG